jgi:hypothetical protein
VAVEVKLARRDERGRVRLPAGCEPVAQPALVGDACEAGVGAVDAAGERRELPSPIPACTRSPRSLTSDGLARLGRHVDPDRPEAPVLASVAELLDRRNRYAESTEPLDGSRGAGFHLVAVAATVARTATAPPPALNTDNDG